MELDIAIQIKNATLEDLQRLFGKQDISSIYPARAVIAPGEDLREENLARSTIPGDELKSPETTKKEVGNRYHQTWDIPFNTVTESAKYEYARKICKRFNKPYPEAIKLAEDAGKKPVPAKEKIGARHLNNSPFQWTHEEIAAIEDCPDQHAAAKRYKKKFPDSKRRPWAVEQRWYIITKGRRGITPGAKSKNGVIVLPAAEDVVERSENTKKGDAKQTPDSISHPEIASGMYVKQIKPYKGSQILGTSMVLSRNGNLVEVRNGNKKKHTIDVECLELAESPGKQPAAIKPAKSKKPSGHQVTCPYCDHSCNSHAMHLHVRNKHPEKYKEYLNRKSVKPDEVVEVVKKPFPSPPETRAAALPSQEQEPVMEAVVPDDDYDIHINGIEGLDENTPPEEGDAAIAPPQKPFPSSPEKRAAAILSPFKSPVSEFPIGAHVRQVKPFLDRTTAGIGSVTAHVRGLIEVNWGGQKYYKIDPSCLEVV